VFAFFVCGVGSGEFVVLCRVVCARKSPDVQQVDARHACVSRICGTPYVNASVVVMGASVP
jgi:hypothetical protein